MKKKKKKKNQINCDSKQLLNQVTFHHTGKKQKNNV
jgi:hypothetical protein